MNKFRFSLFADWLERNNILYGLSLSARLNQSFRYQIGFSPLIQGFVNFIMNVNIKHFVIQYFILI